MESSKFNIFYYSNKCKHCASLLEFISKNGLTRELDCICIDKRSFQKSSWIVQLENANTHTLPPNIDRVPALLLVKEKYQVKFGDDIRNHFQPQVHSDNETATLGNGEPQPYQGGPGIPSSGTYSAP